MTVLQREPISDGFMKTRPSIVRPLRLPKNLNSSFVVATIFAGAILFSPGTTATSPNPPATPYLQIFSPGTKLKTMLTTQSVQTTARCKTAGVCGGQSGQLLVLMESTIFPHYNAVPLNPLTNSFTVEAWIRTSQTTGEMYIVSSYG